MRSTLRAPRTRLGRRLASESLAGHTIQVQAQRLYDVYAELARAFQLRDRERTSCHGLSISGCHALEVLTMRGPATMSELAGALFLENSTVTRLVDRMEAAGLVTRLPDPGDDRVTRVHPTYRGRRLMASIRASLVAEQAQALRQLAPEAREAVITALNLLLEAFRARQAGSRSRARDAECPPEVCDTVEFASLCPATAACMRMCVALHSRLPIPDEDTQETTPVASDVPRR